jgi:DNA-binding MarR family transcriptional regulator
MQKRHAARERRSAGTATGRNHRGSVAASDHDDAPSSMAVLKQFRELFRVSQRHFQRLEARCGISGAQLWALSEVGRRPGSTVSELARSLSIHLSTSSNLLDKLERQALIRRERRSADQRIVRIYVTAAGKKVLAKAPKPVEGVIPDALAKMGAPALRRLHRDLEELLQLAAVRSSRAAMKPLAEP